MKHFTADTSHRSYSRKSVGNKRPVSRSRSVRLELSAGGVVVRQQGQLWLVALLKTVHKRGEVWVLPKGHVELAAGEKVSDAARREVEEEAGLRDLSVKNQLGITRFTFQAEAAVVKKTVHYFLMVTQQKKLIPQADEGLIDAQWFTFDQARENLAYDTDRDIVARAEQTVTKQPRTRPRVPRIHR